LYRPAREYLSSEYPPFWKKISGNILLLDIVYMNFVLYEGTTADCTQAAALIDGIVAQFLPADSGYDTNELTDKALASGCEIVIPPKKNRKDQRWYDKDIYRVRHLAENTFPHLKRWRGIATRYAKTLASSTAVVQVRCIALWLRVLA
jgi:transposase